VVVLAQHHGCKRKVAAWKKKSQSKECIFKSSCVDQAVSPNAIELALYFCLAAFLDDCISSSAKTLPLEMTIHSI
jgi:hypothetical protein